MGQAAGELDQRRGQQQAKPDRAQPPEKQGGPSVGGVGPYCPEQSGRPGMTNRTPPRDGATLAHLSVPTYFATTQHAEYEQTMEDHHDRCDQDGNDKLQQCTQQQVATPSELRRALNESENQAQNLRQQQ